VARPNGNATSPVPADPPITILKRLETAINAHDLEGLVDCFADDYWNETPLHPSRGFVGRDQVRRNWSQILVGVPDLRAALVRSVIVDDEAWAEWDWRGTLRDGAVVHLRGTTIQGIRDGQATWARFYMEPVDEAVEVVDSVIQRTMMADRANSRP